MPLLMAIDGAVRDGRDGYQALARPSPNLRPKPQLPGPAHLVGRDRAGLGQLDHH